MKLISDVLSLISVRNGFLIVALLAGLIGPSSVQAQLEGRIAERPIGVGYLRDVDQVRIFEYFQRLGQRLEVGQTMLKLEETELLSSLKSEVEQPVSGVAWYMVQGLLPSFETLYFQQVLDEADARRMLTAQAKVMGSNSSMESRDGGLFKLIQSSSWEISVPEGQSPEEYVKQLQQNSSDTSHQVRMSASLVDKDGKQVVEQSWSHIQYCRYHDELLFTAGFSEVWDMDLTSKDSLTSNVDIHNDMGLTAYFDRIPMGIKQLGWNMLNSTAGTQLQQRDDEPRTTGNLRRSAGELGLAVVKAIMFDIDQAEGWLRFATEEQQSVRGELTFQARRNSQLTKQLHDLASGASRFAPILNDEAAATLHVCARMSKDADSVFNATAEWLRQQISESLSGDAVMADAASRISESINGLTSHRMLEAFVKAGWTETSGGVLYGGIVVDDTPEVLRAIYDLATSASGSSTEVNDALSLVEISGRPVIQFVLPSGTTEVMAKETSLKISHLFVTHQNSCLWFAAGGENAFDVVQQSLIRSSATGLAARTPLLTAKIDAERWLSYPQEDETGITKLLTWLDVNSAAFPPSPMSVSMPGNPSSPQNLTPLLQRTFDLGGDQTMELTILADQSGIRLNLNMGEAIANYYLAKIMDSQDRMMTRNLQEATDDVVPATTAEPATVK